MAIYTRTLLKTSIASMISGTVSDTDLNTILNRAARQVISEIDMHSHIRKSSLSPNLCDEIYDYAAPTDLKMDGIVDIQPQINRTKNEAWEYTSPEEFDRIKGGNNEYGVCAMSEKGMIKMVRISKTIEDDSETIDELSSVGDWAAYGDGTNLTGDSSNYVKSVASINWDINSDGGTTAGIYNGSLTSFDISDYLMTGSVFVWVYITSTTNLTNFIIRIGSSSSAYYSVTITTNNEGLSFETGWNLLRFDLEDKVETGTVDDDDCTYVALYMTKDALKTDETDYRFNYLVLKAGERYNLIYYSKYAWQDDSGTYLENSTDDTDYINADTEEISLIESKAAELGERHLRNHREAIENLQLYKEQKGEYLLRHPSQAMVMTTTYHFI